MDEGDDDESIKKFYFFCKILFLKKFFEIDESSHVDSDLTDDKVKQVKNVSVFLIFVFFSFILFLSIQRRRAKAKRIRARNAQRR